MDDGQHVPPDGISGKEVAEEARDIPELVVVVSMDGLVILDERLLEQVGPESIDLGEALAEQAEEFGICLFLAATFNDHRREFVL